MSPSARLRASAAAYMRATCPRDPSTWEPARRVGGSYTRGHRVAVCLRERGFEATLYKQDHYKATLSHAQCSRDGATRDAARAALADALDAAVSDYARRAAMVAP